MFKGKPRCYICRRSLPRDGQCPSCKSAARVARRVKTQVGVRADKAERERRLREHAERISKGEES